MKKSLFVALSALSLLAAACKPPAPKTAANASAPKTEEPVRVSGQPPKECNDNPKVVCNFDESSGAWKIYIVTVKEPEIPEPTVWNKADASPEPSSQPASQPTYVTREEYEKGMGEVGEGLKKSHEYTKSIDPQAVPVVPLVVPPPPTEPQYGKPPLVVPAGPVVIRAVYGEAPTCAPGEKAMKWGNYSPYYVEFSFSMKGKEYWIAERLEPSTNPGYKQVHYYTCLPDGLALSIKMTLYTTATASTSTTQYSASAVVGMGNVKLQYRP